MTEQITLHEKMQTTWFKDVTTGGASNRDKEKDIKEAIIRLKDSFMILGDRAPSKHDLFTVNDIEYHMNKVFGKELTE